MISSDLNQLLKKIKQHHRSALLRAPLRGAVLLFVLLTSPSRVCTLSVSLAPPCLFLLLFVLLAFLSSLLPPHDNESLPCGKGIICGTGSKMPCEPHYRMHDYHDSGAALVSTSFPSRSLFPPDLRGTYIVHTYIETARIFPLYISCRYRRGIAETVNQRQRLCGL